MANELTYEWKLTGIVKSTPSNLPVDDVIIGTRWTVTGTDADGNAGTFTGATPFELATVDPDNFTSYADLTEEQVLGWVKNYVQVVNPYWTHIVEQIEKQIEKNQQVVSEVYEADLPWSPTSGSAPVAPAEAIAQQDSQAQNEVSGSEVSGSGE
jgi:hypothetical protein